MSDFTQEGALNTTGLVLPKASVRRIMKINDEVGNISADAVVVATKAAELFLLQLVEASKAESALANRKIIKLEDVLLSVEKNQVKYEFLNDAFIPKSK
eukprot:gene6394-6889_t